MLPCIRRKGVFGNFAVMMKARDDELQLVLKTRDSELQLAILSRVQQHFKLLGDLCDLFVGWRTRNVLTRF